MKYTIFFLSFISSMAVAEVKYANLPTVTFHKVIVPRSEAEVKVEMANCEYEMQKATGSFNDLGYSAVQQPKCTHTVESYPGGNTADKVNAEGVFAHR